MWMIQEARPWLGDFPVAAALDSCLVCWDLPLGLLLVASAYWELSLLLRLLPVFSAYWDMCFLLGWFLRTFCVVRPSSFSLGSLRYFGILMSGFGASRA